MHEDIWYVLKSIIYLGKHSAFDVHEVSDPNQERPRFTQGQTESTKCAWKDKIMIRIMPRIHKELVA
jgi:hypothetical protein